MSTMSPKNTSPIKKVALYSACAIGMCAVFAALLRFYDGRGSGVILLFLLVFWTYAAFSTVDSGLVNIDELDAEKSTQRDTKTSPSPNRGQ